MKRTLSFIIMLALFVSALCSCGASLDKISGAYKIEGTLYYATLIDTAFNPADKYKIEETDGKIKLSHNYLGISGEDASVEIGELKKFSLRKSNFDELIFGGAWDEAYSAENIRKNNKSAWKAEGKSGETVYIMLQEDGTVLAASMKTKESVTFCAHIRKISLASE